MCCRLGFGAHFLRMTLSKFDFSHDGNNTVANVYGVAICRGIWVCLPVLTELWEIAE